MSIAVFGCYSAQDKTIMTLTTDFTPTDDIITIVMEIDDVTTPHNNRAFWLICAVFEKKQVY